METPVANEASTFSFSLPLANIVQSLRGLGSSGQSTQLALPVDLEEGQENRGSTDQQATTNEPMEHKEGCTTIAIIGILAVFILFFILLYTTAANEGNASSNSTAENQQ
eukprot:snap_masked-scaffold_18-processed-gene-5.22-mRNA-1 protein AED:1.00 eAED:1.00 QI:0/-1/0/0/-1/1/1/0/108